MQIQNKNQKIKNIDQKLQIHQSEIDRNKNIIDELSSNFFNLKECLQREKQKNMLEEKKYKMAKQELERANKLLRNRTMKLEENTKKIGQLEKQLEGCKLSIGKNEEYCKTIVMLRNKYCVLEENLAEVKIGLLEKEKENGRLRERIVSIEGQKGKQQQYANRLAEKDSLIVSIKLALSEATQQKSRQCELRKGKQAQLDILRLQVVALNEIKQQANRLSRDWQTKCDKLEQKLGSLQKQNKEIIAKNKKQQSQQSRLKQQFDEIKLKCDQIAMKMDQKIKDNQNKQQKNVKLLQRIKQLQSSIDTTERQKDKIKPIEAKLDQLKKKSNMLEGLYGTMLPQIQCPFGHELINPVTVIPCGHNYCLGCKKGYTKECLQCNGKLKIEAVYRNQLMDDIIGIVGAVKQVIDILK